MTMISVIIDHSLDIPVKDKHNELRLRSIVFATLTSFTISVGLGLSQYCTRITRKHLQIVFLTSSAEAQHDLAFHYFVLLVLVTLFANLISAYDSYA